MNAIRRVREIWRDEGARGFFFRFSCYVSPANLGPLRRRLERVVEQKYVRCISDSVWAREFAETYLPDEAPAPGAHILDFGCGRGRVSGLLAQAGYHVFAVDPHLSENRIRHEAVEYAEADHNILFSQPEKTFDGGVCFQVIEYIPEADRVLEGLARVLRPGAFLTLQTPNLRNLVTRLTGQQLGYWPRNAYRRYYSEEEMGEMLRRHGFRVESVLYEKFYMPVFTYFYNALYEGVFPEGWKRAVDRAVPPGWRGLMTFQCRRD